MVGPCIVVAGFIPAMKQFVMLKRRSENKIALILEIQGFEMIGFEYLP